MDDLPPASLAPPRVGGGPAPLRRTQSVRRTTSIDTHWPDGRDQPAAFVARSRDVMTHTDGSATVLDAHEITGRASLQRQILTLRGDPDAGLLQRLEGLRAGGQLRAELRQIFPEPSQREAGLYLLLDDLAGATLVSSWAWFAWDGYSEALGNVVRGADISGWNGSMRGICIGLRDGSSALDAHGFPKMEEQYSAAVPDLTHPDDPDGWHPFPSLPAATMRRARWIDVWREEENIVAQSGFQDSGARRKGGRQAIHEYRVRATISADGRILDLTATPHVLPHGDCPAAVLNLGRLVGGRLLDLRDMVPQLLAKEQGCTHLNDVVRALAGVSGLARHLPF